MGIDLATEQWDFYGCERVVILLQDGQSSKKAGLGNVEVFETDTIQKREMID